MELPASDPRSKYDWRMSMYMEQGEESADTGYCGTGNDGCAAVRQGVR